MFVASTFRRTIAHVFDEMLGFMFWIPLVVIIIKHLSRGEDLVVGWKWVLIPWLARIVYEVLCIYTLQALPAQYFLGLKILSTHRPELGLGLSQIFIRVLTGQLKYILGPSIYFLALFHRERQHLGDILAETHVVQFNERLFYPKMRFILGSILVFGSLVSSLNTACEFVTNNKITRAGLEFTLINEM